MFGRLTLLGFIAAGLAVSCVVSDGFGQNKASGADKSLTQSSPMPVVNLPADSPESLQRKIREIQSWTPTQKDRLDFALKDVTRIVRFSDLGFGPKMEVAMPPQPSRNWPVANSVRLRLGREITAVVTRFKIDTLPIPRVRGEGFLGLMGVHGDTLTGRDVELQRTMASSGRVELQFIQNVLFGATACCNLPQNFALSRYGKSNDTLTMIFTFDPSTTKFMISIIGPTAGRTFPGFSYGLFRTERGEFHRDLQDFPYMYQNPDSDYVNLYVGSRFRGRKSQLEPVLRVSLF